GEGKGGGNWTSGEISLTLAEQEGKTLMTYAGQGNLGGPLASVGQRLVDTVGRQLIDQGTKVLAEEIAARHRASPGAATVESTSAAAGASGQLAAAAGASNLSAAGSTAQTRGISSQTIAVVLGVLVVLALVVYFGFLR
ncbi:MAG: SRPBCC domain-containing protein, partial [Chloroflexi bacterium]|nr:SRPBCC domain-containing protein [Chloroflexota bacterium]